MKNQDMAAHQTSETLYGGITKREHFAGLAMAGLCNAHTQDGTWAHDARDVARAAVEYADALLRELGE